MESGLNIIYNNYFFISLVVSFISSINYFLRNALRNAFKIFIYKSSILKYLLNLAARDVLVLNMRCYDQTQRDEYSQPDQLSMSDCSI